MRASRYAKLLLGAVVLAAGVLVLAVLLGSGASRSGRPEAHTRSGDTARPAIALDANGPSFASLSALELKADLIVRGAAVSHTTGTVPGSTGVPQTVYKVRIDDVLQGDVGLVGKTTPVFVLGGPSNGTVYELKGLQTLKHGTKYIFFLAKSSQGGYYPLGGAALGALKANGSFTLPAAVTSGTGLTAKVADMVCKGSVAKGRYVARTRGGAARNRYSARTTKRIGRRKATRYAVKLVQGCQVVATGSVKDKLLSLTVKPLSGSGKAQRYPRLRGSYTLRFNGGRTAIPTVRVAIR